MFGFDYLFAVCLLVVAFDLQGACVCSLVSFVWLVVIIVDDGVVCLLLVLECVYWFMLVRCLIFVYFVVCFGVWYSVAYCSDFCLFDGFVCCLFSSVSGCFE